MKTRLKPLFYLTLTLFCVFFYATFFLWPNIGIAQYKESKNHHVSSDKLLKGNTFKMRRYTFSNGGGITSSTSLNLQGTIGQIDSYEMEGGGYKLKGGIWPANEIINNNLIFLDGFESQNLQ